ncbi:MAG TPA: Mur ligase family protein, partial [Chitinophagales bacterium]|nr:Mur ligase family protein [Chitinophagales bacterium]
MLSYSISKIATIINGSLELIEDKKIETVAIDSRNIQLGSSNILFFCLVGEQNNGHRYIQKCYESGVRNFVISETIEFSKYADANFICVENTISALQSFAQFHRLQFLIPVIGITGSNGKTIIKEWLYQLLSSDKNVVKSPKSYNSQVGVPLSVLNMEPSNE